MKKICLKTKMFILLLVGINDDEMTDVKKIFDSLKIVDKNFKIIGHVPQDKVIFYLKASDVLVMNYPNTPHYAYAMSPMKLFAKIRAG